MWRMLYVLSQNVKLGKKVGPLNLYAIMDVMRENLALLYIPWEEASPWDMVGFKTLGISTKGS